MADDTSSMARLRRKEQDAGATSNGRVTPNGTLSPPSKPPPSSTPSQDPYLATNILSIYIPTLTFIFAGCCSNVYTLESLISASPSSGPLLTFVQFLFVSLFSSSSCLSISKTPPFIHLKPRSIPIVKWGIYTVMFVTINLLNNAAFGYRISVPLHIILRSAGPVTSMAVSYFFNRACYPKIKVVAVALLFSGVVLAALSDSYARSSNAETLATTSHIPDTGPSKTAVLKQQAPGFVLLFLALLLSAFLGLYTDKLYATHGRGPQATAESLFYSHTLSLPFFGLQFQSLTNNFQTLTATSPPLSTSLALNASTLGLGPTSTFHQILMLIPTAVVMLILNALTQCICISGVNRLSAKSSSLTVSIVLNIRKLVSLLLSIWLFGNKLPSGVAAGAVLVFLGGGLYAYPTKGVQGWGTGPNEKGSVDKIEGRKEL